MQNTLKTFLLLGILTVILVTLGGMFGGRGGLWLAFIFSLLMNGGMYFFSDKLALKMSGAKPLARNQAPEVCATVEELAQKMKMPMPKNTRLITAIHISGPGLESIYENWASLKSINRLAISIPNPRMMVFMFTNKLKVL